MMMVMVSVIITTSINARDGTTITGEKQSVKLPVVKATFPTLQVKESRISNRITDESDLYELNRNRETIGGKKQSDWKTNFGLPEKIPINEKFLQENRNRIRADPKSDVIA